MFTFTLAPYIMHLACTTEHQVTEFNMDLLPIRVTSTLT